MGYDHPYSTGRRRGRDDHDTPDGPYVTFEGLSHPARTNNAYMVAKMPRSTARVTSVEDEANLFLLLNGGGTQQTEDSVARAARIAGKR